MNFREMLKERVEKAQVEQKKQQELSVGKLLDNPNFVEAQRSISAKEDELLRLNTMTKQLNAIDPFISGDGHRYNVNVYPINFFGPGMGEVLGIIASSRSAFTDELALQYSAITGLSMIELMEANQALGSPAYFSKEGEVMESIPGNIEKLKVLLGSILLKLEIYEFNAQSITNDRIDLWFTKAELTTKKKLEEWKKNLQLDSTTNFTMED